MFDWRIRDGTHGCSQEPTPFGRMPVIAWSAEMDRLINGAILAPRARPGARRRLRGQRDCSSNRQSSGRASGTRPSSRGVWVVAKRASRPSPLAEGCDLPCGKHLHLPQPAPKGSRPRTARGRQRRGSPKRDVRWTLPVRLDPKRDWVGHITHGPPIRRSRGLRNRPASQFP